MRTTLLPMRIIFLVFSNWFRHFLIKCLQSGCITVVTVRPCVRIRWTKTSCERLNKIKTFSSQKESLTYGSPVVSGSTYPWLNALFPGLRGMLEKCTINDISVTDGYLKRCGSGRLSR